MTTGVKKKRPTKVSPSIEKLLEDSARDDLIVTPPMNEFLNSWDETYPPHVLKRIMEVMGDTSRRTDKKRRFSWSASSAGQCMRRRMFQFLGMPVIGKPEPRLRRVFLNGTWVHLRYQAMFMTAEIIDNIEVTIRRKSWRARCTMDGMGVATQGRYDGAEFGFELKSTSDWSFASQSIASLSGASKYFEKTRAQVDFEFMLSGFDLFVILNENKNNQEVEEWVLVRDEDRVDAVRKDLDELNQRLDKMVLHPKLEECKKRLKNGEFYRCPYGGDGGICATTGTWPSRIPT